MKGKMDIQLPKNMFTPGEIIEGRVIIELNSPQKAKGVSVQLVGERRESRYNSATKKNTSTMVTVFNFTLPLDGEKEYPAKQKLEYPFQLKTPDTHSANPQIEGTAGKIFNVLQPFLASNPINWFVRAKLDISGFDVNKSVKIIIS